MSSSFDAIIARFASPIALFDAMPSWFAAMSSSFDAIIARFSSPIILFDAMSCSFSAISSAFAHSTLPKLG